ncbi:MAG TPA: hypothetical protein VH330_09745 [Candidatus Udaeobacter sp.]|jgi:hypothetical protein
MKRLHKTTLIGTIGMAGGLMIAFPVGKVESGIPSVKVPGAYPYEENTRVPAPTIVDTSEVPTPVPFPYQQSSPPQSATQDRASRTANARRPLTTKAVRTAAFKYNGVSNFCAFLAALPANVSVFDPKSGTTRALVEGGRVVRKNVAWLRKDKKAARKQNRTLVSVEELGGRRPGI